jgi:transcriptional regulator with XRE-family HTH domain
MPEQPTDDGGVPGLAKKLEQLFAVVPKESGGRHTNESAAQALTEAGVKVSAVHISHLRSGRRNNPSARLLAAIATLFGVEVGYFFDSAVEEKTNADLARLRALADSGAQNVMMRSGVSPKNLKYLDQILNSIRTDLEKAARDQDEPQ